MHKSSHSKMEWFKNTYLDVSDNLKILDVGSLDNRGTYNYSDIFDEKNWNYSGLDIKEGNNVDIVVRDIYNWSEIEDKTYDVIISGQFFEHLEFFWLTMSQIERVLKPGGHICIIAPSTGPKHGGKGPCCYKFHDDGLKALAKYVNLEVMHVSVNIDNESRPWHDACLVAYKEDFPHQKEDEYSNSQTKNKGNKLNSILNTINRK